MYPKVSIQIPTYNQQRFIQKTIESCLIQDYPNLEINIADDCSTDNTNKLVQPFLQDKRVRYFRNEINIGRVANYNKALYIYATGEWAINLDGDDFFTDASFVSRAIEQIKNANDENIFIYQANHNINKIIKVLPIFKKIDENTILVDGTDYFNTFYRINVFYHCATLYKRSEALKLNFYSYNCLYSDFNSMAKLFLKGKILLSAKEVAVWSLHQENASSTLDEKKLQNEIAAIDEIADFSTNYLPGKSVKKWRRKMKGNLFGAYIDFQTNAVQKRKVLRYMIFNLGFDLQQYKNLIKAILGSIGIKFA